MRIVFLGLPGVGKGTQAKTVAEKLSVPHISTGDMFRDPAIMDSEVGKKAKSIMKDGGLVPDEIVDGMVAERLKQDDVRNGYLLDGYPRTLPQAKAFAKLQESRHEALDVVLFLNAPEDIVVERLSGRRSCQKCKEVYQLSFNPPKQEGVCDKCGSASLYQREDDSPEAVHNRLDVYNDLTGPLVPFYEEVGILRTINGVGSTNEVFDKICLALNLLKQ